MKMSTPGASMFVALEDHTVRVKISGRANFTSSVDFRTLLTELRQRGQTRFVLDLSECVIMDSTFLGVLAGLGMRFSKPQNGQGPARIELMNPSPRVASLIDNLGILGLFTVLKSEAPAAVDFKPVMENTPEASKAEVTRTCLEAHQTLMAVNPANVAKFKDVTKFLAEDLKRIESESAPAGGPG
jgi:anti-anti-sigma factor